MSEKQFDQVISVNLKGTFLVTQAVARHLVEHLKQNPLDESTKSYGSIINLASVVGKVGKFVEKYAIKIRNMFLYFKKKYGNLGQANYAASKAGVEGFTRTTAKELGKYRIRCNAILPGISLIENLFAFKFD